MRSCTSLRKVSKVGRVGARYLKCVGSDDDVRLRQAVLDLPGVLFVRSYFVPPCRLFSGSRLRGAALLAADATVPKTRLDV